MAALPHLFAAVAGWRSGTRSLHYYQGDAAVRHADGAFTFRGRSDEVINVGGNRIGTAEIETALLLDRELPDSPVLNCVVVGVPDLDPRLDAVRVYCAEAAAHSLTPSEEGRLCTGVKQRVGVVPLTLHLPSPRCRRRLAEKYMRSLLRALMTDAQVPNLGAVRNPECIEQLKQAIGRPRRLQTTARSRRRILIAGTAAAARAAVGSTAIADGPLSCEASLRRRGRAAQPSYGLRPRLSRLDTPC